MKIIKYKKFSFIVIATALISAGIFVSLYQIQQQNQAFADDRNAMINKCIQDSIAPSVHSIKDKPSASNDYNRGACYRCYRRNDKNETSTARQGAIWFNDSKNELNSDTITLKYTNRKLPSTINIYMHGGVFSCGSKLATNFYAAGIRIYEHNTYSSSGFGKPHGTKVDFISFPKNYLLRGVTDGNQFKWFSGDAMKGKLDVKKFIKAAEAQGGCSVTGSFGEDKTTVRECSLIVDVYRYPSQKATVNVGGTDDGVDPVKITLKNIKYEDDEEETFNATAGFSSETSVEVVATAGTPPEFKWSEVDKTTQIEAKTTESTVTLKFNYEMYYGPDSKIEGENIATQYKIADRVLSADDTKTDSTKWAVADRNKEQTLNTIPEEEVTVTFASGETEKTVCRYINYAPKKYTEKYKMGLIPQFGEMKEDGTADIIGYIEGPVLEFAGFGGKGESGICVKIKHVPNLDKTIELGGSSLDVIFAGEDTTLSWNVSATGGSYSRLYEAVPLVIIYPPEVPGGSTTNGGIYKPSSVCNFFYNKKAANCIEEDFSELTKINPGPDAEGGTSSSGNTTKNYAVMDSVGWKLCNSFAYRYHGWKQYWPPHATEPVWIRVPSRDYWKVYNSTCRTVAKKPSMSITNGNFMTNGGTSTSLSYRYDNPGTAEPISNGGLGERRLYGSWTEHLLVAGNTIKGTGSGATLANGSTRSGDRIYDNDESKTNSLLTIANNTDELGSSGIANNSTFNSRLTTYLRSLNPTPKKTALTDLGTVNGDTINVTETKVIEHTGDLTIDKNIVIEDGDYDSIYKLPQAIIFVDGGNVKIASDVTQIDAWIITTGEIDTCKEFHTSSTEAVALKKDGSVYNHPACKKKLVINGPVMAKSLKLHRSYGSDPLTTDLEDRLGDDDGRATPAEIFNLRADVYLWANAQSTRYESSYNEVYSREIAPRY